MPSLPAPPPGIPTPERPTPPWLPSPPPARPGAAASLRRASSAGVYLPPASPPRSAWWSCNRIHSGSAPVGLASPPPPAAPPAPSGAPCPPPAVLWRRWLPAVTALDTTDTISSSAREAAAGGAAASHAMAPCLYRWKRLIASRRGSMSERCAPAAAASDAS
eukprot:scaffold7440_cov70-Isochrysis_galbana.AAC.1